MRTSILEHSLLFDDNDAANNETEDSDDDDDGNDDGDGDGYDG